MKSFKINLLREGGLQGNLRHALPEKDLHRQRWDNVDVKSDRVPVMHRYMTGHPLLQV